jgi:L-malate glycosyltransferase
MSIASPMCTGNGAYVVHKTLERKVPKYRVLPYNPYWTVFPPSLLLFSDLQAPVIHTTPDHAIFLTPPRAMLLLTFHNYVLDAAMRPYSSTPQQIHYRTDLRLFTRLALQRASKVTAVSKATAELIRQDLQYRGKVDVIPNGVDTGVFRPPSSRSASSQLRVLFSGNPTCRKGAHWLLPIIQHVNASVRVHCTGGLRRGGMALHHPRLIHLGAIPYGVMPHLYRSMDVLLMPTIREGMSLAVLEAMASGLPIVASNTSSLPELVHHGQGGFLCPTGNVEAFADALNQLSEDTAMRHRMGEYNRTLAESRFGENQMTAAYAEMFETLAVRL